MNKVLILQEIIPHYRIPLFDEIGNDPDISLAVAYDGKTKFSNAGNFSFKAIPYVNGKLWKFFDIKGIRAIAGEFDQVIMLFDLRWLPTFIKLLWYKKNAKIYFWGIGISSEKGIRKKPLLDRLRFFLTDISAGTILYSDKIAGYYLQHVRKKDHVHVAANTILVERFPFPAGERTRILSIGSFKAYKNLGSLVIAFSKVIDRIPPHITLDFIGDGEDEPRLRALVQQFNLQNRVIFWGRKESDEDIYPIISKAIVSVSPAQAGLSVLHAMAFGCPFLTSYNAITGGERFYIDDNVNSYFYDATVEGLADKIVWIINNPEFNEQVAANAYDFYHTKCSIRNYADTFINIIKNVDYESVNVGS